MGRKKIWLPDELKERKNKRERERYKNSNTEQKERKRQQGRENDKRRSKSRQEYKHLYWIKNKDRLAKKRYENDLLKKYNITSEKYYNLLNEQKECCAICGNNKPNGKYNKWHVDHCHETKKVRGLLCQRCNLGIGLFEDDDILLMKARTYLIRYK